jgi:hypothetical protein
MAENKDIGFKLEINGVEKSISSIKDLKGAIKDLQDVAENSDIGSEQYKQAIEDLEKLNDQLKEVTQTERQAAKAAEDLAKAEKEAAKETGDLRKQFETLEDELFMLAGQGKQNSEQFRKLSVEAAALNKKIDDVNQSLSGNGTERAEAGFSKFGESLKKLDFKGVAQGAKLMGTALAATGIMLIVQLVGYLISNFDELSKGSGGLAKALKFVGDIIGEILKAGEQMLNFLTDAIGLTSELERTQEAMGKKAIDSFTKSKEALGEQTAEMDRNIKVAKAMGKNTVEMEIEKQKAIIETNKQYLLQLQQMSKTRAITEEERKLVKEAAKSIKDANAEIQIIEANANKEKAATTKTNNETAKANRDKQLADEKKLLDDIQKERLASMKDRDAAAYMQLELDKQRALEEINATKASEEIKTQARFSAQQDYIAKVEALDKQIEDKKLADEEKLKADAETKRLADLEKEKKFQDELLAIAKEKEAKRLAQEKAAEDARFQIAQNSINSLQGLSDMYFLFKTKNLEKGSAEELRQAKRQFDINKGLQIASATIAGIQGVQNALSATSILPEPLATAFRISNAIAVGVASAANIAKIAASQFSVGGGASGGGGAATPASAPIPAPPTVNTPGANVEGTRFDQEGNKINNQQTPMIQVNATVGVDEITAKSNRVQVLENQSKF